MIGKVLIVLKNVAPLKDKCPTAIIKLKGGLTNNVYKVEYDKEEFYIVRLFGPGTEILGIDRDREDAVSHAVASAGAAPDVIAYFPKGSVPAISDFLGAAVIRFVIGRQIVPEDAQRLDILRRIAETLKRCHATPLDARFAPFSVYAAVSEYLDKAQSRDVAVPSAMGDALVLLKRIEKECAHGEPSCLCHNDLLAGNFIDDGSKMLIIDWEYGARGDRFFDLGNFAVSLQMSEEQEKALLHAYFGEARPEHLRRLKLMRLASDLRESTWGYLQSAISTVEPREYYLEYGKRHLDRFLSDARTCGL